MKQVVVTADDFGIAEEINRGIIHAHLRGIVTSASLLTNAPATLNAIQLAKECPTLEIGIHLSLVEGISLRGRHGTTTDELRYFNDSICLHRHWRPFVLRYVTGRIKIAEIEEELRLQFESFLEHFDRIPFANATQHLHLLPGIQELVIKLCREYKVEALRVPSSKDGHGRFPFDVALKILGKRMRKNLGANKFTAPMCTDQFAGFHVSGCLTESDLMKIIDNLGEGTTEIMTHPGFNSRFLRTNLSWGYRHFRWEQELEALTSPMVRGMIRAQGIAITSFSGLRSEEQHG